MTLQELYSVIGGNYAHAQQIMKMDKLIDRYIRQLKTSGVYEQMTAAGEKMDPVGLFESAHAMKGVCANLGLDDLAAMAEIITEEFRPGKSRCMSDEEVKEKLSEIDKLYRKTLDGIERYENE